MSDLPVVNAVDELKEQVTLDRQALQKSLRAGLLNVVKSINSLHDSFNAAFDVQKRMLDAQEAAALAMREKDLEDARKKKDKGGMSSAIAAITNDIGYSGLLLATSIGVVGGLIQGQILAIKKSFKIVGNIFKSITKFLKLIITNTIGKLAEFLSKKSKKLQNAFSVVSNAFSKMKTFAMGIINGIKNFDIKAVFTSIGQGISSAIKGLKTTFITKSGLGAAFEQLKKIFKPFIDTMKRAVSTIKGLVSGPAKTLTGIFSTFGGVVSKVAGVVGRVFAPLTIILTAFETVRGVIAGYAEGGFLGAIQGGIEAFFNTLIFKPLDFIKGIISSIVGFFGGDKISEALDSFSFEKLFKDLMDAIFGGVKTIVSSIKDSVFGIFRGGDDDKEPEAPRSLRKQQAEESKAKLRARAAAGDPNVKVTTSRGGRLDDAQTDTDFLLSDEEKAEKKRAEGLSDEEYLKERNEKLKKNIAALSAREAEQQKKIAESEAKMRALGYDPSKSMGEIDRDDENQMAARKERSKILAAKAKLSDITTEKTLSQDELDFIKDTPQRGSQAQNNVNSNVNNVTTNNTSSMNKTTAMPANAGRQGGAQYKTASGFG